MPSLGQQSARGVVWLFAQAGSARLISFFSQVLLARLLAPGVFGDIAFVSAMAAVMTTIVTFGVDDVMLSRMPRVRCWVMPAMLAGLTIGLSCALGLVLSSLLWSPLPGLFALVAVSLPLNAAATVPSVCLRADLRFRTIAAWGTGEFVGVQALTLALAWHGWGAYSFFVPIPLAAAVRALVLWRLAKLEWRGPVRLWPIRVLIAQGKPVLGQKLLRSLRENGDYLLLGVLAKKSDLGLYFLAFRLAALPVYTLVSGLSGVLFPALARLRLEPGRQHAAVMSASRALALTVIPLSFLQAAVAPAFVRLLFGEKWRGSSGLLSILTLGLAFDAIPCVAGALLAANGRFQAQWHWSAVTIFIFFSLIGLGYAAAGVFGVACAVALFFVLTAPAFSYFAFRHLGVGWRDIRGIYGPPVLCSALAVGVGVLVARLPQIEGRDLATIGVIGAFSVVAYAPAVRWLSPAATRETWQKFSLLWGRAI